MKSGTVILVVAGVGAAGLGLLWFLRRGGTPAGMTPARTDPYIATQQSQNPPAPKGESNVYDLGIALAGAAGSAIGSYYTNQQKTNAATPPPATKPAAPAAGSGGSSYTVKPAA